MLEERFDDVLSRYDIKVHSLSRVRSGFLIEAGRSYYLLKRAEGSERRLEYEEKVTDFLIASGYPNVDRPIRNQENLLVTEDGAGERYLLKEWYKGEECNVRDKETLLEAAANLAQIHRILENTEIAGSPDYNEAFLLEEMMKKHTRELKRVYSYIRGKKQKNEFEISILNSFSAFFEQAERALEAIQKFPLEELLKEGRKKGTLVHGAYTYHNILFTSRGIATLNFDKGGVGLQIMDLYYFMRKAMEKNEWKLAVGEKMIQEYNKRNYLEQSQWELLAILLSYPEKYWKILNHYFNNKKSWIAVKNIEKLEAVREMEGKKRIFLKEVFSLSF